MVEQPITELLNKTINKRQVEGSGQYCCGATAGTLARLRWIADILARWARFHNLLPTPLHAQIVHSKPFGRFSPTFDSLAASMRLID